MFIKFTDYPRMINLNNFDELQIDDGDYGAAVIAIKYAPSYETGVFASTSTVSQITIKRFDEAEEAQRLYDAIIDAWANGEKIFEICLEDDFDEED